jgi:hypothetical protein
LAFVALAWSPNETRAPVLNWWNTALGPSGLLVNPAHLSLPQLGQPPLDTPHGAAAEREGLKLHEYPVQNCPMHILRNLAEPDIGAENLAAKENSCQLKLTHRVYLAF